MLLIADVGLTPDAIGRLTDREAWEWYLRPAAERAERMREAREGRGPAPGDRVPSEPATEEDDLAYLRRIGVVGVPDAPRNGEP